MHDKAYEITLNPFHMYRFSLDTGSFYRSQGIHQSQHALGRNAGKNVASCSQHFPTLYIFTDLCVI